MCISGPTTRQTLRRYVAYVKYVKYVRGGKRGCMGEGVDSLIVGTLNVMHARTGHNIFVCGCARGS